MLDPIFDFVYLAHDVRMEHNVLPIHPGLDVLRGKFRAETRLARLAHGEFLDDFLVENQAAAHRRLAFAHRLEPQDTLPPKPVFAAENTLHVQPLFQVVARQDELGGFARGKNAAVITAFDSAKFRKFAALRQMLGNELAEKVRLQVRHQSQD